MNPYTLRQFREDCRTRAGRCCSPAECVEAIVPAMHHLLNGDRSFLTPEHRRVDREHYARNLIFVEEGVCSLYALVWQPGQWTPIHDHGTWGVVGVLEGALQETSYIRTDDRPRDALAGLALTFGNVIMLSAGSVTSFVPNPDHIHRTGNGGDRDLVVSLHLYGRAMAGYHEYDRPAGTRQWVEVSHFECDSEI